MTSRVNTNTVSEVIQSLEHRPECFGFKQLIDAAQSFANEDLP